MLEDLNREWGRKKEGVGNRKGGFWEGVGLWLSVEGLGNDL